MDLHRSACLYVVQTSWHDETALRQPRYSIGHPVRKIKLTNNMSHMPTFSLEIFNAQDVAGRRQVDDISVKTLGELQKTYIKNSF